ncbi:YEATS domain-containing protein 4 [Nematocida sp. AWRm77]|nr:YEATS domain-containing protein 4 [Nematocida sp. AWRm77]
MRINHANLTRTILYGTVAEKVAEPHGDATHKWKVYVRGYKNTNISYFVRSVTFKTHETFANPTRSVDSPPFEIEESGWGEFTIQGKIYFVDVHEKPVSFLISLKLHPDPNNKVVGDIEYLSTAVYNERMDTIVFESPTETMYKLIKEHPEEELSPDLQEKVVAERKRIEGAIDFIIQKLGTEDK